MGGSRYDKAIVQPDTSIAAGTWSIASVDYVTVTASGEYVPCQAAELDATGTTGILMVHLVNDPAATGYPMPLEAGYRNSAIFDKVFKTGTTVDASKVTLFPLLGVGTSYSR